MIEQLQAMFRQALAFHQQGRFDEAQEGYGAILAICPDHFDTRHLLGLVATAKGAQAQGRKLIREAIACNPAAAPAYANLGTVLMSMDEPRAALACYDRALAVQPGDPGGYSNRANARLRLHRPSEAIADYCHAIALQPSYADGYVNLCDAYRSVGKLSAALRQGDRGLTLRPDHADGYNNRGNVRYALRRAAAAIADYDRALALKPDHVDALNNRGAAVLAVADGAAALTWFDRTLAMRPDHVDAHSNRGNALMVLRRVADAVRAYDIALALDHDHEEALLNKGLAVLLLGDFTAGWPLFEWRSRRRGARAGARRFDAPQWRGDQSIAGKTILLHGEQGFGDTLQFCRYAEKVASLGARVILEAPRILHPLLRGLAGVAAVISSEDVPPPFNVHCPLMSLPLAFGTTIETIPRPNPYLQADPAVVARWSARLGPRLRPRVGLAWRGNPAHDNDRRRSLSLAVLRPFLPTTCDFVSLMPEWPAADAAERQGTPSIRHVGNDIADFGDTAALCALMDVVVSVDTSVAHLAGALGRPTWILLPLVPDWRWLLDRRDSPWYSSVTLYRQTVDCDWTTVLSELGADLAQLTA